MKNTDRNVKTVIPAFRRKSGLFSEVHPGMEMMYSRIKPNVKLKPAKPDLNVTGLSRSSNILFICFFIAPL